MSRLANDGDDRGGHTTSFRGLRPRRAHAAHRARPGDRRLPRRPLHRRGDAQPRRPALDRPAVGRAGGYRPAGCPPPTASASSASSPTMSAPRCMPAPARLGRTAGNRRAVRGPVAAGGGGAGLRDPQARRRRLHPRRLCRRRHHAGRPGRSCCASPSATRKNILVAGGTSTGKTTLVNALLAEVAKTADRVVLIEDTRELQCARAQPRRAAHQGRRRLAVRSRPLLAAAAARPHPDRRGARRRGARSPESLGHRPSRRHRHHPRRLRDRRAAPARTAHPGSRRHRPARADRRDHRSHRGAAPAAAPRRRLAELASSTASARPATTSSPPAGDDLDAARRPIMIRFSLSPTLARVACPAVRSRPDARFAPAYAAGSNMPWEHAAQRRSWNRSRARSPRSSR